MPEFAAHPLPEKCVRTLPLTALALLACAPAVSESWKGQGELGLLLARGTSDTETGNAKLDVATDRNSWRHSFIANALYGRSNAVESAQRWDARWQTDYKLDGKPFIFSSLRHEQDQYGGFEYQSTATTGVGYQFIETDEIKLQGSLGLGYRSLRPQQLTFDPEGNVIGRIESEQTSDTVANGSLYYQHQITSNTTLFNNLLVESGQDNTFTRNNLSLQVAMTETFALSLGYGLRHNTKPPQGLEKLDQLTTVNLVYRFQ